MVGVHTKHFPALAETLTVFCVDHVCHSMAVIIVPMPDIPYTALAAQVPKLKDGGWKRYLAHCNYLRLQMKLTEVKVKRTVLPNCWANLVW